MLRFKGVVIALTLLAAFLTGCSEETVEERIGSALLTPSVVVNPEVVSVQGVDISTLGEDTPDASELHFRLSSSDGKYSNTWPSVVDYPVREPLRPGMYVMEAFYGSEYDEGFDHPYFYGSTQLSLSSGESASATVTASLANVMYNVEYTRAFLDYFPSGHAILHAVGGQYLAYPRGEGRNIFLRPGHASIILNITMPDGSQLEFLAATIPLTKAGHLYSAVIDVVDTDTASPRIIISFDDLISTDDVEVALTPDFIHSQSPALTAQGFESGTAINITEGAYDGSPLIVDVSNAEGGSLVLTTRAPALLAAGWPAEVDLMNCSTGQLESMRSLGLQLTNNGDNISHVDFTNVMKHLRFDNGQQSNAFSLLAFSRTGKIAGPVRLLATVMEVDMAVLSVSDVMIGQNIAQMQILARGADLSGGNLVIQVLDANGSWQDVTIDAITPDAKAPGESTVTFTIPQAARSTVDIRVIYCGNEKLRQTLRLCSPDFTISVDPFALLAAVKIEAADPAMAKLITSLAHIYINGVHTMLISRKTEADVIVVGGLEQSKSYTVKATLFDSDASDITFTPSVEFRTESARQLPNGSFEEIRKSINYDNLPAGGRYSQNIVDIFNQQNYVSWQLSVPKSWAETNAKTFCTQARNHNSWYMQPSVYTTKEFFDGSYAVTLQSVAYDLDGPAIPDYRQTSTPYVNYNRNIPTIAHRAAGKLFLGEYRWDASTQTESYTEGISFQSRPSALNGYYKFMPKINALSDCGLVVVEILGNVNGSEIVISRAIKELPVAQTYTAFSAPISYSDFGVKATKIKVMFSSSKDIGNIDYETAHVVTLSDPVTASSIGGVLTIDGLTFSY